MKQSDPSKLGTQTWQELNKIAHLGYPMSDVFRDFLDVCLNTILSCTDNLERSTIGELMEKCQTSTLDGEYAQRSMQIAAKYPENQTRPEGQRPGDFFATAFLALQTETHEAQEDVLGFLYERYLSRGEHGQFVTPPDISQLMMTLTNHQQGDRVYEPGVGSGRLLIAAAKCNPRRHFIGVDISHSLGRCLVGGIFYAAGISGSQTCSHICKDMNRRECLVMHGFTKASRR